MKIEDARNDSSNFIGIEKFVFGDVLESESGDICLVIIAEEDGTPHPNGVWNGLVSLRHHKVYPNRSKFPKLRRIDAKLVIENYQRK